MSLETELKQLTSLLHDRAAKHGVAGAALAVGRGTELFESAAGYVNFGARIEATSDSVFQIGSITKLFTATLAMQLVDEGLIDLESPVRLVLPEFQVADEEASREITLAHLLSHSSGIDGDYFLDTGNGDDSVERYVLACSALPQLHAPGERHSYCNAGFVIVGRIIEKLRGKPWHQVLREGILNPLGLSSVGTKAEEAVFYRAAVGHLQRSDASEPTVIPIYSLAASNGPAGATPFGRARDLIPFAQLHLNEGVAADGKRLLSAATIALMQECRVEMPHHAHMNGQGLGWMLFDWSGKRIIGHDGSTIGQASFLRLDPTTGLIVSMLTTGGNAAALYRDIYQEVMGDLCEISLPALPEDSPTVEVPLSVYEGRYARLAAEFEVKVEDGKLKLTATGLKPPMNLLPRVETSLRPISPGAFVVEQPGGLAGSPVLFGGFDEEGRAGYIEVGLRAAPRVR